MVTLLPVRLDVETYMLVLKGLNSRLKVLLPIPTSSKIVSVTSITPTEDGLLKAT